MLLIRTAAIIAGLAAFGSCRAEGPSYYLGESPPEYFLTMARCRREATSAFPEGGSRYSGYSCVSKFLWFTLAVPVRAFADGRDLEANPPLTIMQIQRVG